MKLRLYRNYRELLKKEFGILYFIYFTFFLFNGVFESSIPLLYEAAGYPETLYSIFYLQITWSVFSCQV